MNREELQEKLTQALVGKSVYYNYKVVDYVRPLLKEWFNDEQGYYGMWADNYTFTITYKRRRLVDFSVRRKKDDVHDYVIKGVEVDKDFVDTETQIKVIHNGYVKDATKGWRYVEQRRNLNDLRELFRLVKNANPNMSANDLWSLIYDLHNDFWLVEEIETNGVEED